MILEKTKYTPEEYLDKVYTVKPLYLDDTYLVYSHGDKQFVLTREFTLEYQKTSDRIEVLRSGSSIHIYNYDTGELVSVSGQVEPEYRSRILKKCPHNTRAKPYLAGIRLVIGDRVYDLKDKMDAWVSFPDKFKLTPKFGDGGMFIGYDIAKNDSTFIETDRYTIKEYGDHRVIIDTINHTQLHLDSYDEVSIVAPNLLKITNRGLLLYYTTFVKYGIVKLKKNIISHNKMVVKMKGAAAVLYDRSNKHFYLYYSRENYLIKIKDRAKVIRYFYS